VDEPDEIVGKIINGRLVIVKTARRPRTVQCAYPDCNVRVSTQQEMDAHIDHHLMIDNLEMEMVVAMPDEDGFFTVTSADEEEG